MSKLNVKSKNILSEKELYFIRNKLLNESINIVSLENIYEHLELQAFYNNTNLLFIIKTPILKIEIFTEYLLEQIPTKDNKTIDLPYNQSYYKNQPRNLF